MKKSVILIFVIIAVISTKFTAQNVGLGNTDPSVFSKFRIPETNLSSLWFDTGLNFNSDKTTSSGYAQSMISGYNLLNSYFTYSLSPTYYLLKQTDEKWLSLNATINESYSYSYSEQQYLDSTLTHNRNKFNQFILSLQGSYGKYFSNHYMFYSFGSTISTNIRNNYFDNSRTSHYEGDQLQNYDISIGIGWGKIRDVTPVVSAIRLQERLKQLNLLNNDLSENTIEDLSEQFSKSIYYSQVHDRADKFFWQDIEKALLNDGISLAGLNQYGSSYLREVPNEIRFLRNEGIMTGCKIMISYDHDYSAYFDVFDPEHLNILGNVYLNLSHQLNLNSQFRYSLSLSGGPNVSKDSYYRQKYIIQSTIGYNYEITDKIVTSVSDAFNCAFQNNSASYYSNDSKTIYNNFSLSINYFIEDNLSLNASYMWNYNDSRTNDETITNKYAESTNNIVVGFTYYINRGFLYN